MNNNKNYKLIAELEQLQYIKLHNEEKEKTLEEYNALKNELLSLEELIKIHSIKKYLNTPD